jgi:D-aminopeptidase
MIKKCSVVCGLLTVFSLMAGAQERGRARDFGLEPGILSPGRWNAITDVEGVSVGHCTLIEGDSVRTGVTVIKPYS